MIDEAHMFPGSNRDPNYRYTGKWYSEPLPTVITYRDIGLQIVSLSLIFLVSAAFWPPFFDVWYDRGQVVRFLALTVFFLWALVQFLVLYNVHRSPAPLLFVSALAGWSILVICGMDRLPAAVWVAIFLNVVMLFIQIHRASRVAKNTENKEEPSQ